MRTLLAILGVFHAANGLAMLAAPGDWYLLVPGVTETGPANIHFIRDIGLAFLAAGAGLVLALRHGGSAALVPSAIFLGGHAALHMAEIILHGHVGPDALRDVAIIVIPGVLPAYAIWHLSGTTIERNAS